MALIPIYCPGEVHEKEKVVELTGKIIPPALKILLILEGDIGKAKILVQCNDNACKKSADNRGWYLVSKNSTGGFVVQPTEDHPYFRLNRTPVAVMHKPEDPQHERSS